MKEVLLTSSVLILALLILRQVFWKKISRRAQYALWGLVLARLLIPVTLESPLSIVPSALPGQEQQTVLPNTPQAPARDSIQGQPNAGTADPVTNDPAEPSLAIPGNVTPAALPGQPEQTGSPWQAVIAGVWLAGAIAMGGYALFSYLRLRRRLFDAIRARDGAWEHPDLDSPFILGVFRPRIYLPAGLVGQPRQFILCHERAHLRRLDHIVKPLCWAALALHWFNPLVWASFILMSRDIESACDEATLSFLKGDSRKSYACSLMAMAVPGQRGSLLYSSFSKSEVERRVKGVLAYRKAGKFLVSLTAVLALGITTVFATGGTTFYDGWLCSGIEAEGCYMLVDVGLNRDVSLGEFAQGRANAAVYRVLAESAGKNKGRSQVDAEVAEALSQEFGVEPGAFRVNSYLVIPHEVVLEQYARLGITMKDSRYYYEGTLVHAIYDRKKDSPTYTTASSWADGGVDLYILRDETGAIIEDEFKAFLWYRF